MASRSGWPPGGILDLAIGDYVLVHAGQVLDRISADEAEQILALYASLEGPTSLL